MAALLRGTTVRPHPDEPFAKDCLVGAFLSVLIWIVIALISYNLLS